MVSNIAKIPVSVFYLYQIILAIIAVFLFFTNLDVYLYSSGKTPYPPLYFIAVFSIFSIPVILDNKAKIPVNILIWSAGFILISSIADLIVINHSHYIAYQELETRILSNIFLMVMLFSFSRYYLVQLWSRRAILIAVLMAIANNIYDFFHPFVFSSLNVGRPAGFYINPNQAGAALVLGLIFSIGILKKKYRVLFLLLVGLGVLLTLSRAAIISWLIVVLLLVKTKVVSWRQLLYSTSLSVSLIALIALGFNFFQINWLETIGNINHFYQYFINMRFDSLTNPLALDSSDSLRFRVLKLSWELFINNPLIGNGIGSTLDWSESVSTHNMYLFFMADHGILGALILPLLVVVVTWGARGEAKRIGVMFTVFILIWGLFSHNILGERYVLITFSLMAAMTVTSRQEQRYINQK